MNDPRSSDRSTGVNAVNSGVSRSSPDLSNPSLPTKRTSPSQPFPILNDIIPQIKEFLAPYHLNILFGVLFGFALHRARVHETSIIIGQMNFSHFVMLKMFLSAAAISILSFWALPKYFNKTVDRSILTTQFPRGIDGAVIGSLFLGCGMTLAGSCPASVFAQIGSGSFGGVVVLVGGFVGAYLYGLYDSYCVRNPEFRDYRMAGKLPPAKTQLENVIAGGQYSYDIIAPAIASGLLLFSFLLEIIFDWKKDIASVEANASWFNAYPGMLAGILVGVSQFLNYYYTSAPLGSSSSFSCVIANQCPVADSSYHQVVKKSHRYQVALMLGVSIGASISALFALRMYVGADISYLRLFIGGMFIIFGGQFSQGCTSGHGMTGLGMLSTYSAVAVAGMFGSAILTKLILSIFGH